MNIVNLDSNKADKFSQVSRFYYCEAFWKASLGIYGRINHNKVILRSVPF